MTDADLTLSRHSREYIRVPVAATDNGEPIDPTEDAVAFAFTERGDQPTTWADGDWETDDDLFYARCLVGPGTDAELDPGIYTVWVKVTDSPEIPVLASGLLGIT